MGTIFTLILGAALGFIAGVFVYRNNAKLLGGIATKIDDLYDQIRDLKEKQS